MCGITGIINLNGVPVDAGELQRMNSALKHRGPDGEGYYSHENVGLAHRRLAIIDPHGGVQPFYNDNRSVVLSFNGEVYNYVEIRKDLDSEFEFRTQSDTEVVLRAYEKWGIECISRFRGMFALALFDVKKGSLYLVRDRVGIKPLYYFHSSRRLLFASEVSAILAAEDVQHNIAIESISGFFRYQYIPTPATIYKNLYKLEPGCYLKINVKDGSLIKQRYWNLQVKVEDRPEVEWLDELNALLDDTLRIYVRSDVPFGAFLSGGVDSSLVSAIMSGILENPVRTFTIGFNEEEHSELPFAAEAARTIQTVHYEKIVSPQLAEDLLVRMVKHFGEPFADSSAIPTYFVAREAVSQVKMVLSGDGGDELFGGYNSYKTTFRTFSSPPGSLLEKLIHSFGGYITTPVTKKWTSQRFASCFQSDYDAQRQIFRDTDLQKLLLPDLPIAPPVTIALDIGYPMVDPVTMFQVQDFLTYMVDDVLTKVDRMSMANSLEVRVPLLDHKLVELAFSLPLNFKLRWNHHAKRIDTKYLLKRSALRYYPESFLSRKKQGFGIPVVEWCRGPLRHVIESRLKDPRALSYTWLQYNYVQSLLTEFFQGNDSLTAKVWFLLMFELWAAHVHSKN